jgi:hypothetical protein
MFGVGVVGWVWGVPVSFKTSRKKLASYLNRHHPSPISTHPPGEALKANITTLGPLVLPVSEQLLFAANLVARKVLGFKKLKSYMPDFGLAFDHVCIHTGALAAALTVRVRSGLAGDFDQPNNQPAPTNHTTRPPPPPQAAAPSSTPSSPSSASAGSWWNPPGRGSTASATSPAAASGALGAVLCVLEGGVWRCDQR